MFITNLSLIWSLHASLMVLVIINPADGSHKTFWDYGKDHKGCYGTENGMSSSSKLSDHIQMLRNMYTNCTKVYGNLEIVGITMNDLKDQGLDSLDFFDKIEEVAGYVLISNVILPHLSLPRLRIIWGDKLYTPQAHGGGLEDFSFLIISSSVKTLDLRSLRSVVEGRIGLVHTEGFCHWKNAHIDWNQILDIGYDRSRVNLKIEINDTCLEPAHTHTCNGCQYCWGPSPEHCQEIYRTGCPHCTTGCFNHSGPSYCCSPQCAAGCFGSKNDECYGCKSMRDNNTCVDKCPSKEVYNIKTTQYEHNPDGKYAWVRECVSECPSHMFVYKEGCVGRCPEGYYAEDNNTICKQCEGPCPKICHIDAPLSSMNINEFINCTVIDGRIEIRPDTLIGGMHFSPDATFSIEYHGLTIEDLEALSGVERITHYLLVQTSEHEAMKTLTSLKFLRNLKQIDGKKKFQERYAIHITNNGFDELKELGLRSLKKVLDGDVYIHGNYELCFVDTLPWDKIVFGTRRVIDVNNNRDRVLCERAYRKCSDMCEPSSGCWAQGADMCYECRYFKLNHTCIRECPASENYYPNGKRCERCHDECNGCTGPGPSNCVHCKSVLLANNCVEACPPSHYENKTQSRCLECHPNCSPHECTGPGNFVGQGGCNRCKLGVINDDKISSCLPESAGSKDCKSYAGLENFYWGLPMSELKSYVDKACLKCDAECKTCIAPGIQDGPKSQCQCKNMRLFTKAGDAYGTCVNECPLNSYNISKDCYPCHKQCDNCYGPESTQCYKCRGYMDYFDQIANKFNCTATCPIDRPYSSNYICMDVDTTKVTADQHNRSKVIIGVVLAAVFLALIVVCTVLFVWRRRVRALKYLEPADVIFEMHPDAKPNLTRLRLILETQLVKGPILGYGAFGTVFRGFWYPDERKTKVLVAIKVLHESNPAAQKEMLDEAGIMASMENPYLVQLIGVCIGQQLMLVTPLFPLGNLLEYVQNNKHRIGSLALLRWCTQIAQGMAYLEEQRLVHRDLAARNVLVKTPYHIRITDFGLAKMLEYGEEELRIYEGKMPIKWLALECIQYRRYTHKSDVWAYGVTIWELMTFGEKPYKDVPLQQIPALLESGVRLPQPQICSLDIYLLLVRCWMVDANARPSFIELGKEFTAMMKDPGRYLVIAGDSLMRLPSYSSTDKRHMLEQFEDEDEEISIKEADDFLRAGASSPTTPVSPLSPLLGDSSGVADPDTIAPHLVQEAAARIQPGHRQSTSSHRYAADPLKKSRISSGAGKPSVAFSTVTTDTDNYLVPDAGRSGSSPSASTMPKNSVNYIPVLDESTAEEDAMDFYDYLRTAESESTNLLSRSPAMENQGYMMANSIRNQIKIEDPNHNMPENETVL